MTRLEAALRRLAEDLGSLGVDWAVIGGLAVSVRAEPRTTRDVDLALAAPSDEQAEELVRLLGARGYRLREEGMLDNVATGRLAAVRLSAPGEPSEGVVVDLMFNPSGIEAETIAAADRLEVFPRLLVPVARLPHLLAMKLLAGRARDVADAHALLARASPRDLDDTRAAAALIAARGCARGRDLAEILRRLVAGEPIEVLG